MRAIPRRSLVDVAIDELRERIDSGSWPIGHRLPAEARLAEELGISRASVREATRALAHTGLIASRQGDGTFVTARSESDAALRRQLPELGDGTLTWLDAPAQVLAYSRPGGGGGAEFQSWTNFGSEPVALPAGEVLISSGDLVDGQLPADTTVWLKA